MSGKSACSRLAQLGCAIECLPILTGIAGVVMGSEIVELHMELFQVNLNYVHDKPFKVLKVEPLDLYNWSRLIHNSY